MVKSYSSEYEISIFDPLTENKLYVEDSSSELVKLHVSGSPKILLDHEDIKSLIGFLSKIVKKE